MTVKIDCAYDQLVEVEKLVPHPRNNNRHSIEQIEALSKLIKAHGFRHALVVSNRSGFIVAGHGRLEAARKLGIEKLPVDFQDFSSEAEEYQCLTADNEIARWAELDYQNIYDTLKELPDVDVSLLGIEDFKLPEEEVIPQCDEDEVPEAPPIPKTKRGDIFELGNHRLMCGDSTMIDDVEKLMNGEKADMVFTDPPYGINLKIGGGNGNGLAKKTEYHYIKNDDSISVAVDCFNLCKGLGIEKLVFWGANYFLEALDNTKCFICWDKRGELPDDDFCGTEIAWTNCNKHTKTIKVSWKGMIKEGEQGKRLHPNQKPILLIEKCFDYLNSKNIILDLFGGSGSTLIACEKTQRQSYNMELDEKYCDVIINRWQKFTGKKAYLLKDNEKIEFDSL